MKLSLTYLMMISALAISGCSSMSSNDEPPMYQTQTPPAQVEAEPIEVAMEQPSRNILFAFDSYDLSDNQSSVINEWIEYLTQVEATEISVHGHADEVGTEVYNFELSKKRAQTIKQLLEDKLNKPVEVKVYAYGETMPVVDGDSESNRQMNRRVELKATQTENSDTFLTADSTTEQQAASKPQR